MARDIVRELLDRNRDHTDSLPANYFDAVQTIQEPPVVSVCCSDSRVSQERMFDVEEAGYLFTVSNIGNQVHDERGGDVVVDGNLMYPIHYTETKTAVVIGHTRCGAVTAAYRSVTGKEDIEQLGVLERVEKLLPIVVSGLESERVDDDADDDAVVDQLVEYNVNSQIEFLQGHDDLPDDVSVYGFVYDFHGSYGDVPGRTYVVNADGETDPAAIRSELTDEYDEFARSLLDS